MKKLITTLKSNTIKRIVHFKDFKDAQSFFDFVCSNASDIPATVNMDDQQLKSLEQLLGVAYELGHQHGQDFMDGKRPQDSPVEEDTIYTAYEGEW
tara:strand:+ start:666 stop:953 length:288 start_codon:yes stop_codon:yes gene_type:complete